MTDRIWLEACFAAAVEAVRGDRLGVPDPSALIPDPGGRLRVIGLGKAAMAMARGAIRALNASPAITAASKASRMPPIEGLLIVKEDSPNPSRSEIFDVAEADLSLGAWRILQGGHPIADARSLRAGQALLDFVAHSSAADRYLILLSGGASALAVQPITGLTLEQKSACVQALMQQGAPISALNVLRRHLSRLKGGGLAQAIAPAQHVTLAISDVPDDDPTVLGSAPTLVLPREPATVVALLKEYGLWTSWQSLLQPLLFPSASPSDGPLSPTAGSSSAELGCSYHVVASLDQALAAAEAQGRAAGLHTVNLGRAFYGELHTHVAQFCQLIREQTARTTGMGTLILAGGEPTLRVTGSGRGGRAQHFALACAEAIQGLSQVTILVAGTDGSDGPTPAAGAVIEGGSWAAMRDAGVDPAQALRDCDSFTALQSIDALLHTGATGTNVADLFLAVVR